MSFWVEFKSRCSGELRIQSEGNGGVTPTPLPVNADDLEAWIVHDNPLANIPGVEPRKGNKYTHG